MWKFWQCDTTKTTFMSFLLCEYEYHKFRLRECSTTITLLIWLFSSVNMLMTWWTLRIRESKAPNTVFIWHFSCLSMHVIECTSALKWLFSSVSTHMAEEDEKKNALLEKWIYMPSHLCEYEEDLIKLQNERKHNYENCTYMLSVLCEYTSVLIVTEWLHFEECVHKYDWKW